MVERHVRALNRIANSNKNGYVRDHAVKVYVYAVAFILAAQRRLWFM